MYYDLSDKTVRFLFSPLPPSVCLCAGEFSGGAEVNRREGVDEPTQARHGHRQVHHERAHRAVESPQRDALCKPHSRSLTTFRLFRARELKFRVSVFRARELKFNVSVFRARELKFDVSVFRPHELKFHVSVFRARELKFNVSVFRPRELKFHVSVFRSHELKFRVSAFRAYMKA